MEEKTTVEAVKQIKNILDRHNVHYWIHVGTLLGAVRDGKIIPWDKDFDLATWNTEIEKIVTSFSEISDKGFEIHFNSTNSHIKFLKEECKIDIAIFKLNKKENKAELSYHTSSNLIGSVVDYLIWMTKLKSPRVKESMLPPTVNHMNFKMMKLLPKNFKKFLKNILKTIYMKFLSIQLNVSIPSHFFKSLRYIEFYGMKFKAPRQMEEYLTYRYGKDWRIPKKDWKTYRDDNAVSVNG